MPSELYYRFLLRVDHVTCSPNVAGVSFRDEGSGLVVACVKPDQVVWYQCFGEYGNCWRTFMLGHMRSILLTVAHDVR